MNRYIWKVENKAIYAFSVLYMSGLLRFCREHPFDKYHYATWGSSGCFWYHTVSLPSPGALGVGVQVLAMGGCRGGLWQGRTKGCPVLVPGNPPEDRAELSSQYDGASGKTGLRNGFFFFFLPGRKNKDHLKQSGQETSVRTSVRPRRAWKYALKTFIVCPSPATD